MFQEQNEVYTYIAPQMPACGVVFNSAHSGRNYPKDFVEASQLSLNELRSSEDAFVDKLFADAPHHGMGLLSAHMPRAYVDLNRDAEDLDPALIEGVALKSTDHRISAGLGVIPRVVAEGREIQSGKMPHAEARARLEKYYHPYHQKLSALIEAARQEFGRALLIDCHSMPSTVSDGQKENVDIVLGDRFGTTISQPYIEMIETSLKAKGFSVSRNLPFAGAHIIREYSNPPLGIHAIQIEINRALYLHEDRVEPSENFQNLRRDLNLFISEIAEFFAPSGSCAAE